MGQPRNAPLNVTYLEIMERARRTNRERERIDRLTGCQVPRDVGARTFLEAAISAIECGLLVQDWNSVAEGLVMLFDLHKTFLKTGRKEPRSHANTKLGR